jgi:fluoride ion exporter CrcB/FEX
MVTRQVQVATADGDAAIPPNRKASMNLPPDADWLDALRPLLVVFSVPLTLTICLIVSILAGCVFLLPLTAAFTRDVLQQSFGTFANVEEAYTHPEATTVASMMDESKESPSPAVSARPNVVHSAHHSGVRACGWISLPFVLAGAILTSLGYSMLLTLIWLPICGAAIALAWIPHRMFTCLNISQPEFNPFWSCYQGLKRLLRVWQGYYESQNLLPVHRQLSPSSSSASIHPFRYLGLAESARWMDVAADVEHEAVVEDLVDIGRRELRAKGHRESKRRVIMSEAVSYSVVALGGAMGAVLRYALGIATASFDTLESSVTSPLHSYADGFHPSPSPTSFLPVSTLLANVIGCLLIGVFSSALNDHVVAAHTSEFWRPFLVTGICGGLTTFSALLLETLELALQAADHPERAWMPIVNLLLHHVLCIAAVIGASTATEKALPYIPAYRIAREQPRSVTPQSV